MDKVEILNYLKLNLDKEIDIKEISRKGSGITAKITYTIMINNEKHYF